MASFSNQQLDVLAEFVNQGAGIAADALSKMAGSEVQQYVPSAKEQTPVEIIAAFQDDEVRDVCWVSQDFFGPISCQAILLFKRQQSLIISQLFLSEELTPDYFDDLEREALGEIGNIVLNAAYSQLANALNFPFEENIPTAGMGNIEGLSALAIMKPSSQQLLNLKVLISVSQLTIEAHIMFLFDEESATLLDKKILHYLEEQDLIA